MKLQRRSAARESNVTEHHYFESMLHQIDQAQWENPAEARRRAHVREARNETRTATTSSLRNRISGLKGRSLRRSSAPCPDGSAPC